MAQLLCYNDYRSSFVLRPLDRSGTCAVQPTDGVEYQQMLEDLLLGISDGATNTRLAANGTYSFKDPNISEDYSRLATYGDVSQPGPLPHRRRNKFQKDQECI